MSYLDNMFKRINYYGGKNQVDRINKDKLKSLKKAICTAYQSATVITPEEKEFRCLINPNKINNDYDIKILSIPYSDYCLSGDELVEEPTNIAAGQVVTWKENGSKWLVYLQRLEETAYFRAEMRRCRYSVEINGKKYWIYLRGPVENNIPWVQSGGIYFNKLNETAFMYIEKNEETLDFFARFTKLKIGDQYWEVQATDKISLDGIIEVNLKEDFVDKFVDIQEEIPTIDIEDPNLEPHIAGAQIVKPYDVEKYSVENIADGGTWTVSDKSKARIKSKEEDGVIIEVISSRSGQFTLTYTIEDKQIEMIIKIASL